MNADLDYLYDHHAVGLCPEERCVVARANLAAMVEALEQITGKVEAFGNARQRDFDNQKFVSSTADVAAACRGMAKPARAALQGRVASREGSGTL